MNNRLDKEEIQLSLLRLLENNPELTQRGMTKGMGISLGKINYCLSELSKQGLIRVERFKNSKNKTAYMYHLTPNGIEAIGKLTFNFLKKKIREYDDLKEEIKTLNDLFKKTDTDTNDSELNRHLKRIID
ncbi:MarR family EPS-associated transcriptional regulator [Desulfobacula sp.]|jgi:EPS-associated MarR family transcriptional regulator|uniref:MarR family EPS-associated transcriptional regulator n=1 Tax=Desulfobacula sp. TaxID=2593537 RepID=UPI001ED1A76D|nr:MarR family EPS-associated transcriptional regulator [Desulfobacula sp.]